jgi:hypothetical protein
LKDLE